MISNACTWYCLVSDSIGQVSIVESPRYTERLSDGRPVKYSTRDMGYALRLRSMLTTSTGRLATPRHVQPSVNARGVPMAQRELFAGAEVPSFL